MAEVGFVDSGAKYYLYDQTIPCRKDENGRLEFFMGGEWVLNEGLAKSWDTLADEVSKDELASMLK